MRKIIIIGHKNPDTDSIVASIAMADYCKKVLKQEAVAMRAGNINNETKFILNKFGIKIPALFKKAAPADRLGLVDHNEISQLADGVNFSQVERIVDHHKLQVLTESPLAVRIEPLGSTSSLIAKLYRESGRKVPTLIAKILVAGILSDTLNLTGPTTTMEDKKIVRELNRISKLKINEFVKEMFAAKSSLKGISVETVVSSDYKLFEMGKNKVGAAVWETADPKSVETQKTKIIEFIKLKKNQEELDYMFFFVVDILKQNSLLYIFDEAEKNVAEKVFKVKIEAAGDEIVLPGIVSRKKQIIPLLMAELSK